MSSLPISCSDPRVEVSIRMGSTGNAARPQATVMSRLYSAVERFGGMPAIHQKQLNAAGVLAWRTWTWEQYLAETTNFAKGLVSIGFEPHDSVNILGFNAPPWFFANMGAIMAGGVAAGIYTTNLPEACHYVTHHSKAKVVVVEGLKQLQKYVEIAPRLPDLKCLVVYGEAGQVVDIPKDLKCCVPVYTFEDFQKKGAAVPDDVIETRIKNQRPGHCCTLIYTSGTTGNPKAVMISHDNLSWTSSTMMSIIQALRPTDSLISYLPLSHIAAQMLDLHCPMGSGSQVWFAQADALRGSLGTTLKEVRPTVFFGVPRVWEKIYEKMQQVAKQTTGLKKRVATWAKLTASAKNECIQFSGSKAAKPPCTYGLAKKILVKIHQALGLDRCIMACTGAAPIERKILDYFASIDVPIYELFGQSECTGPHTVNTPSAWKIGTCGRPLPGTESMLVKGNGELCYRGRHIFMGYMYMPAETKETIDEEGWLHSGDVSEFDGDNDPNIPGPSGFMRITGRIKELIITAGGENIPPVLIENEFKLAMPALSNCMCVGDRKKFLAMCLCLQVDVDADTGRPTQKLTGTALETSKAIGSSATTTVEAQKCDKWTAYFNKGMEVANGRTTSRAQCIAKWTLFENDFSEATGELTPTLKLKRKVAVTNYEAAIEAMYAGSGGD